MTVSELEKEGVRKRDYNGLKIYEIAKCPVLIEATTAHSQNEKFVYKGIFTIDRTENSWKYGDQVQFCLFTTEKPYVRQRVNHDGYYRIEIAIPKNIAVKMLESALHKLWFIE